MGRKRAGLQGPLASWLRDSPNVQAPTAPGCGLANALFKAPWANSQLRSGPARAVLPAAGAVPEPSPGRGGLSLLGEFKTLKVGEIAGEPGIARFKNLCRWLVIALAVVVVLAGFNVAVPAGKSAASNWRFAAGHPTILLLVIAASVVLVLAVIAVIRTMDYVGTLRISALSCTSIGWVGSVVAYGAGWQLDRRRQRQQAGSGTLTRARDDRYPGPAGISLCADGSLLRARASARGRWPAPPPASRTRPSCRRPGACRPPVSR